MLTLLLGGARAGKSTLAERIAANSRRVTVIATGVASDAEMTERIARHRQERPDGWTTIESSHELATAISAVKPGSAVIIECLTTWLGNLAVRGDTWATIESAADDALAAAVAHDGPVVAVSNEVGLGIVPTNDLARTYRDVLGRINQRWAEAADQAYFLVAGRALPLHRLEQIEALEPSGEGPA